MRCTIETNLEYVDEKILDDDLFKEAMLYNIDNWEYFIDTKLDAHDNMLLVIETINLYVKHGAKEPGDDIDYDRLLYHISHKHPECMLDACYWRCSPIYLHIKMALTEGWISQLPDEAIHTVLEDDRSIMEEIYDDPKNDPDFMRIIDKFDPELAYKHACERLKNDPSLYSNSNNIKG